MITFEEYAKHCLLYNGFVLIGGLALHSDNIEVDPPSPDLIFGERPDYCEGLIKAGVRIGGCTGNVYTRSMLNLGDRVEAVTGKPVLVLGPHQDSQEAGRDFQRYQERLKALATTHNVWTNYPPVA